jgi:hypothetical protein
MSGFESDDEIPITNYGGDFIKPMVEWYPIATAPKNQFILVACHSGYVTTKWDVTTRWDYRVAQFTEGYHDRWDDCRNDALMDSGLKPLFWCHLPNEPKK